MPTSRRIRAAALLLVPAIVCAFAGAHAAAPVPADVRAADALAAQPASTERDRALAAWAKRAELADLMYVLRRPPRSLGGAEAALASSALEHADGARTDLRRRLLLRLALVDPKRAAKTAGALAPFAADLGPSLDASVFRVAVVLPDSGDYSDYGAAVRAGVEAALAVRARAGTRPVEPLVLSTGNSEPARVAAALDTATARCGALVGELLSTPTLALASASRVTGTPVLSPTATEEQLGAASAAVLQIGPSGRERGAALARQVLEGRPRRIGALVSSTADGATLVPGFLAAATAAGATVAWQEHYASGNRDFRTLVKALTTARVEVLVWDGGPGEAAALFQELASQRTAVTVCGGEALAPDRYHGEVRRLLEGVRVVAEDWHLPAAEQALLDTALSARGAPPADGLAVRGWIAGTLIADAVAGGALAPAEVAAALARRVTADPWGASQRFLDGAARGLTLPVSVVQRGKLVAAQ